MAGQHFRRAIGITPLNTFFRVDYAEFLSDHGDLENAQYELEQAASIDPWATSLQSSIGGMFERKGMFKEAEIRYRRAIELSGISPQAYIDLGRVLEAQGKKDEAINAYKDALKLKSDYTPAQEAVKRLEK